MAASFLLGPRNVTGELDEREALPMQGTANPDATSHATSKRVMTKGVPKESKGLYFLIRQRVLTSQQHFWMLMLTWGGADNDTSQIMAFF